MAHKIQCLQPVQKCQVHMDPHWWWLRLRTTSAGTCTRSWGRRTARTWSCPPSACPLLLPWSHLGPRVWHSHRFLFVICKHSQRQYFQIREALSLPSLEDTHSGYRFPKRIENLVETFALRCLLPQLQSDSQFTLDTANKIFVKKSFPKPRKW